MAELLLELLSEEIPARMQTRGAEDLKRLVCDGLTTSGLGFSDARAFATPRRLALIIKGIPELTQDQTIEQRGPRVGAPDQALQGFLKSAGLTSLDQAEKRDTGKGEFWFAIQRAAGVPAKPSVIGAIEDAFESMSWPKSMRWADHKTSWVRPLHSMVAQLDGVEILVRFPYERNIEALNNPSPANCLASGSTTRGHRFLSEGEIKVRGSADYMNKLRAAHVILDAAERKRMILQDARRLCANAQVSLKDDDDLLDEVAGLVEWPVPMLGTIDPQFMDVPPEVLIVSMKTHQRYFATTKNDGELANRFVVVANNVASDGGKIIVDGNERVLRARLSDAKFFWDQDRKQRLEDRLPALKDIYFHTSLGTQYQRVQRMSSLAKTIRDREYTDALLQVEYGDLKAGASLCKADLVTSMVGEFPELQGVMGGYYARHDGLSADVAAAICEHYSPLGPTDAVPTRGLSIVVALADKLDSLVGFFGIGELPTGSRDPFALRRAALGVIRLIVENGLRLSLRPLLNEHVARFNGQGSVHLQAGGRSGRPLTGLRASTAEDVLSFLAERLKVQMREKGVRHDVVDAIFALGGEDDLVRLLARVEAVQSFLGTEAGKNLLTAYGRAANIVRAEEKKDKTLAARIADAPDAALLEQSEEKAVASALHEVERTIGPALEAEDFAAAMKAFADLRAPIDSFFEKVTVNVADKPDLRLNRLKLLNQIRATMDSVADFSRIEG